MHLMVAAANDAHRNPHAGMSPMPVILPPADRE
jgi:hypothetical protein